MKVYITDDHDKQYILDESIIELMQDSEPSEEELEELDTLDINDGHYDVYGEDYADAILKDLK